MSNSSGHLTPSTNTLLSPSLLSAQTTQHLPRFLRNAHAVFVDSVGLSGTFHSTSPINSYNDFPSTQAYASTPYHFQQNGLMAFTPNEIRTDYNTNATPHFQQNNKFVNIPQAFNMVVEQQYVQDITTSFTDFSQIVDSAAIKLADDVRQSSPDSMADSSDSDLASSPNASNQKLPRKERKMQQNREAATRYREKKRNERKKAKQEEDELKERNSSFKREVEKIQGEIDYLKSLMREIGMSDSDFKYISPVVPL